MPRTLFPVYLLSRFLISFSFSLRFLFSVSEFSSKESISSSTLTTTKQNISGDFRFLCCFLVLFLCFIACFIGPYICSLSFVRHVSFPCSKFFSIFFLYRSLPPFRFSASSFCTWSSFLAHVVLASSHIRGRIQVCLYDPLLLIFWKRLGLVVTLSSKKYKKIYTFLSQNRYQDTKCFEPTFSAKTVLFAPWTSALLIFSHFRQRLFRVCYKKKEENHTLSNIVHNL